MKAWTLLAAAVLVLVPASPPLSAGAPRWQEELQRRRIDPAKVVNPFASTPEMERWAQSVSRGNASQLGRLHRLQAALFDPAQFPFQYDVSLNLTAAEAFQQRRGNCLSFTVLFVSLGRSIGVPVQLLFAERVLRVAREEDLVVLNRHVVAGLPFASSLHVFDFQLDTETAFGHFSPITDLTASAMYHTNIGVRLLRDGDLAAGREQLEIATALDPKLASAWVNLGVAVRRAGDTDGALAAYARALEAEPGNPSALTNIATIHQAAGRADEARAALAAAAQGRSSPYSLVALADIQLARGELGVARRTLARARHAGDAFPELYESLARWARLEGKAERARGYREKAAELRRRAASQPPTETPRVVTADSEPL